MQTSLWDPPSQTSCSVELFTTATKYVSFASMLLYWPLWGYIFKCVGCSDEEWLEESRACMPTWLPVAYCWRWRLIAFISIVLLSWTLVFDSPSDYKLFFVIIKDLWVWICDVIKYTICNECYILFCDAISDPGNSSFIVVLHWAKGRMLQFLDHFHLHPHHIGANAMMTLAAFAALCEAYLGIWPNVELFWWLIYFKTQTVDSLPVLCGAASFYACKPQTSLDWRGRNIARNGSAPSSMWRIWRRGQIISTCLPSMQAGLASEMAGVLHDTSQTYL
jgi:hypothetical protein